MEINGALGSFSSEIRGFIVYTQHRFSPDRVFFGAGQIGTFIPRIPSTKHCTNLNFGFETLARAFYARTAQEHN
jgi:hypothetical protein